MFAFAHVLEFLSNKLARLCRRSFALLRVSAGPFDYFFFWHRRFPFKPKAGLEASWSYKTIWTRKGSIKPSGHGIKRILSGAQNFCDAILALIQGVLNLVHPTASFATDSLQSIFGALGQPLACLLTGKWGKK